MKSGTNQCIPRKKRSYILLGASQEIMRHNPRDRKNCNCWNRSAQPRRIRGFIDGKFDWLTWVTRWPEAGNRQSFGDRCWVGNGPCKQKWTGKQITCWKLKVWNSIRRIRMIINTRKFRIKHYIKYGDQQKTPVGKTTGLVRGDNIPLNLLTSFLMNIVFTT